MHAMESSSGSTRSDSETVSTDLESDRQEERSKCLWSKWRSPAKRAKSYVLPNIFKIIAFFMTATCIFQFVWIHHINAGMIRVANDPFDNIFGQVHRSSPGIWDNERQSFLRNVIPVPVHSHNDYLRRIPLFEALGSGCISVEADVHLHDSDLLVGHDSSSLHSDSTLRSMYLEPLQRMLEAQNAGTGDGTWRGLFDQAPQQTIVLLIDHKSAGPETFAELDKQLQPLRDLDYLTHWNGTERIMRPLTIVLSGNAPFSSVMGLNATHRDIFWDAKLEMLASVDDNFEGDTIVYEYNQSNSYFASTRWQNARLHAWHDEYSPIPYTAAVKDAEASQIEQAKARGLIARYWDMPTDPPNLRDIAWRVLVDLKVGVLNMDDMGAVRARAKGWGTLEL